MNVRRLSVYVFVCFALLTQAAFAASPNVVITQVYGGGGATTGSPAYSNDYVELFNTSNAAVVIGGNSLQYGSSTGQFGSSSSNIYVFPAGTTIGAGKYLTVKLGSGGIGSSFTADLTTTNINMSASAGKVAYVTGSSALGCGATATPCALPHVRIIDLVAYGSGANNAEGGFPVSGSFNSSNGAIRKVECADMDDNNFEFKLATVSTGLVPRTAATPASVCGVVNAAPTITAPANPIVIVAQDSGSFTVSLTGNDDGGVYNWSATAGTGISSVSVSAGQGTSTATFTVTLQSGFNGTAAFTASLSDNVNAATSQAVNIQVNAPANNAPAINAPANPITTVNENAPAFTVALTGSDDHGSYAWSAIAGTGISSVNVTGGQGTASATFTVILQSGFDGTATFTATLSDGVNAPVQQLVNITVTPAPPVVDHLVISQVYGGGGNTGATYKNDYIEIYNPTVGTTFDVAGWTLQYASATGSSWTNMTPLGGLIGPGEYFLVQLAGGTNGSTLPTPNLDGDINMSATTGKIALVKNGDPLSGSCPTSDPDVVDFVGYGTTANCREGSTNAPAPGNSVALFRKNGGFTDTNSNSADFVTGTPNPRRTTPIQEIGPFVVTSDPAANASAAPRDANVIVGFSEAVNVTGQWFDINCVTTGAHNDAEVRSTFGNTQYVIIPNAPFVNGEQCTITVFKDNVSDVDLDDASPLYDNLIANKVITFTTSTGTAPAYTPDVHTAMGNPSDAEPFVWSANNFLMEKPEFTLSYNRDRGTPNWVSWHLADEWVGTLSRVDTFRADSAVPADWYRVLGSDYSGSGFDRGHMVPNADRDKETSIPINQATFLMTNMLPQSPDNNQGPWADMENDLRALLPGNELYIVAGGAGTGGTGSNGFATTIANGNVAVPAQTWKVVLVLPKGENDVTRAAASTRTIAVVMPNIQGIRNDDWHNYLTTIDAVETLTGYDFFENVSDIVENAIEAGVNGANPPGVVDQSASTPEDQSTTIVLNAEAANGNALTYTIVGGPSNGTLSGSGATRTYTPLPDFNGNDSFTFRVSDGSLTSILATVSITISEVNDAPAAGDDAASTNEDNMLTISASSLTANDSAGPANESAQTLTVTAVAATGNTNGTVALNAGVVTYTPAANFNGPASFTYTVCDNGVTAGLTSPQCATGTVNVTVASVNDAPSVSISAPSGIAEGGSVTATATVSDIDANESFTYVWTVTKNGSPFAASTAASFTFTPDDDGAYAISLTVNDANGGSGSASATTNATNVAPAITAVNGPSSQIQLGNAAAINVFYGDPGSADSHTATFNWDDGSTSTVNCAAGLCSGTRTYAGAGVYGVSITVADDDGGTAAAVFNYVIVVNANGGSVTGGGYLGSGNNKSNFNVNAKYLPSGTVSGNVQFSANGFSFDATTMQWLVVSGSNAQIRGTGTVNGASGFAYLVTVADGSPDKFRIRVWNAATNATVYDNVTGASDDLDAANPQAIGGGNITVHTK
jgi:endonuclease G, mitochondrial